MEFGDTKLAIQTLWFEDPLWIRVTESHHSAYYLFNRRRGSRGDGAGRRTPSSTAG